MYTLKVLEWTVRLRLNQDRSDIQLRALSRMSGAGERAAQSGLLQ
jgi:hypothetical protein